MLERLYTVSNKVTDINVVLQDVAALLAEKLMAVEYIG